MQKITPFLWFDSQAEEAANFYVSVFKNSRIISTSNYDEAGAEVSGKVNGSVMTVAFEIEGQEFIALNGGPVFTFSQATSFVVNCESQEVVDNLWGKLSEGGEIQDCGWVVDKYGVTWQIVPTILNKLLSDKDGEKAKRVMKAMLGMKKIEIKGLQDAFDDYEK